MNEPKIPGVYGDVVRPFRFGRSKTLQLPSYHDPRTVKRCPNDENPLEIYYGKRLDENQNIIKVAWVACNKCGYTASCDIENKNEK